MKILNHSGMRVLLLGGNGLFGHRVCQLFALQHIPIEVLVGCRNESKAKQATTELSSFVSNQNDKHVLPKFIPFNIGNISPQNHNNPSKHLSDMLERSKVDIVINTVGPFIFTPATNKIPQCFLIANECALKKIHYIDLADEREYLNRFVEFMDPVAKENNVCLITGASTTPGITMQTMQLLTQANNEKLYKSDSLQAVSSVEWALSPGNKIGKHGSGSATVESILRTLGRPIAEPENSKSENSPPIVWSGLKRYPFKWISSRRYVARVDQVDIDLVNKTFTRNEENQKIPVRCYAGIETSSITWSLNILSTLFYYLTFLKSPTIAVATKLTNLTRVLGSNVGGFSVSVTGIQKDGATSNRTFELLAEGDGPFIPAIPSVAVATKLIQGTHNPGAFVCGTSNANALFSFEDFANIIEKSKLQLYWAVFDENSRNSKYLYHRLMGSAFYRMPNKIQEMHSDSENIQASGSCRVIRGKSWVSRFIGSFLGLANEGDEVPTSVDLVTIRDPKQELWLRNFEGKKFQTIQRESKEGMMIERVGVSTNGIKRYYHPSKWHFSDLITTDAVAIIKGFENGLQWDVKEFRALGGLVRLPKFMEAKTIAEENIVTKDGEEFFQFNVKITLPFHFGLLVHYCGTLKINKKQNV